MKSNFLISLPNEATSCLNFDIESLEEAFNELQVPFTEHFCKESDCCRFSLPCIKSDFHTRFVSQRYKIPFELFHVDVSYWNSESCDYTLKENIVIRVLYRLLGGKGGFGALLKGQGSRKKPSENIDSCRNLSGQRIRTVRLEEQAKQWEERKENANDPELKKLPKVSNAIKSTRTVVVKRLDTKKIKSKVTIGVERQVERLDQKNVEESKAEALRMQLIAKCSEVYEL
ncbi:Sde2 [Babesia duncani]|uniref:Sde2 n=1 Tax=Babesia duncani TaxID=323732 RepID=A0AAD9PKF8_9APIC|nr:Sde2 [Babesia duncani]